MLSTVMGVLLASVVFMLLRLKRAMRTKAAGRVKHGAGEKRPQREGSGGCFL